MINLKGCKEGLKYLKNCNNLIRKITTNTMIVAYIKLKNYKVIILNRRRRLMIKGKLNQKIIILDIILINMRLKSMINKINKLIKWNLKDLNSNLKQIKLKQNLIKSMDNSIQKWTRNYLNLIKEEFLKIDLDQNQFKLKQLVLESIQVKSIIKEIHIDLNRDIVTMKNHLNKIDWDQKKEITEIISIIIRLLKIYFKGQH